MLTLAFADTRVPPPRAGRKVNEWLDGTGRVCAQAFSRSDKQWIVAPGVGVFAFSTGSLEVWAWPKPHARREEISDTFYRVLQPIVMQALGWQTLHAGAAVSAERVFVFCGTSGAGKSTLAFAMRQAGWRQFADDSLVLRFDGDRIMACPLPFKPSLRPASQAYFARTEGKLPAALDQPYVDLPLAAVFVLRQDAKIVSPHLFLIPRAQAFSALLAHARCFDPENRRHTQRFAKFYLELAMWVPVYGLEFQPAFQHLPELMRVTVQAAARITDGHQSPGTKTLVCSR